MFDMLQLIGGMILAVGYLPQIMKILRTHSAKDFAFRTYLLLFLGIACMEVYAVQLTLGGSGGMFLITNTLSLAITGVMCLIIWYFQRTSHIVMDSSIVAPVNEENTNAGNEKNQYTVLLSDKTVYEGIDADSEEEATEVALSWWEERVPEITVQITKEKRR